jgi:hypothetical protein
VLLASYEGVKRSLFSWESDKAVIIASSAILYANGGDDIMRGRKRDGNKERDGEKDRDRELERKRDGDTRDG